MTPNSLNKNTSNFTVADDLGAMRQVEANDSLLMLDEPVTTTILRDLKRIATKLKIVLLPIDRSSSSSNNNNNNTTLKELRDWDLWGPLILCIALSLHLSITAPDGQGSLIFSAVFFIIWVGAAVVTINAQLLGN